MLRRGARRAPTVSPIPSRRLTALFGATVTVLIAMLVVHEVRSRTFLRTPHRELIGIAERLERDDRFYERLQRTDGSLVALGPRRHQGR